MAQHRMKKIAIILRKPPYGDINSAEAVRHALGAVSEELEVSLLLLDSGVLIAKKEHDESGSGFTNLGSTLKDCIDMGVSICADKVSLRQENLDSSDILEGIKVINGPEAAELIDEADQTMIF